MDFDQIKILIEKYFDADTSVEEERLLKEYFANSEVATELEIYKPLFENDVPVLPDQTFDEKILGLIDDNKTGKKSTIVSFFPKWLKIAAVFILIAGGSILWYHQTQNEKIVSPESAQLETPAPEINDTYTDPEHARKELEKALALLSSKLDQGNSAAAQQVNRLQIISKVIPEQN